jgi:TrmH family RNA methyltransferase
VTITSQHNRALKEIRKLRARKRWRERSGRFVAEGEDLLEVADAAGWEPVERYCAAGSGLPGVPVDPAALASISGLASGTRALAVYEERWARTASGPLCVYLHGVTDPGNVGTVLRGAAAFGGSCVALGPGCADPFGPKAVRASMGAVFTVPLTRLDGRAAPEERPRGLDALPGVRVALVPGQGVPLPELWRTVSARPGEKAWVPELTLLVGAEREGLPRAVLAQADLLAHIPIATDSLNAAIAATVALYELATRMARR